MEAAGELRWDIEPYNGRNFFFTRESYEKYYLGPTLGELLLLSKKSAPAEPKKADPKEPIPQPPIQANPNPKIIPFPEPRVPYPCFSSLTALEQNTYVKLMIKFLNTKNAHVNIVQMKDYNHYQFLKSKTSGEIIEFQKFLQNAARSSGEDYDVLCADGALYIQEMLKASQACVRNYPDLYTVHEITSISGGKFIPDLSLNLEKCLLKLGSTRYLKLKFPTGDLSLTTSYWKISNMMPPVKKSARLHSRVTSDPNIPKLTSKYCPHVVLTTQALFTLLNNHGPGYSEQWEIPVRVETINDSDNKPSKVVYLDSPLPKKMLHTREKSQMFHEVLLDQFMVKNSYVVLKVMSLDKDEEEPHLSSSNMQVPCESSEVDFETDVTELETFGSAEIETISNSEESDSKPLEPAPQQSFKSSLLEKFKLEKQIINSSNPAKLDAKSNVKAKNKGRAEKSDLSSDTDDCAGRRSKSILNQSSSTVDNDSDDDRLVIDIDCKRSRFSDEIASPSAASPTVSPKQQPRKSARKISKDIDPVGQILKMQTKLLKAAAKKTEQTTATNPETNDQSIQGMSHLQKIVPVVSDIPQETQSVVDTSKKSLLSSDLLAMKEEEATYTVGPDENFAYKLFSLDDILLLVKSTVHTAKIRVLRKKTKKQIPVFLLTKMNYQTCYGVESLTESETCRLWTESLLHSNCVLHVGHVDALTSKFFSLEEVTAEKLKEKISALKPANCLNTLRHILKWVTGLQDGSYLLSHVAGDSSVCLYKSASENKRGTYNLQEAHQKPTNKPSFASVPWVPLNPNLLLSYHIQHGRPPCTFPPAPDTNTGKAKLNPQRIIAPPSENNTKISSSPKKKKGRNRLKRLKEKQKLWKSQAALQRKT